MRGALVTTHWDDPWSEEDLAVRRVAGAMACFAELDVLVPGGPRTREERFSAVRLVRYQAAPPDRERREALRNILFGPSAPLGPATCVCHSSATERWARELPRRMQEALLALEGGDSLQLTRLLAAKNYDFVVFAGCSAATYLGMAGLPAEQPVVFLPLATQRPVEWLPLLDEAFARADALVVFTEREAAAVRRRAPAAEAKVVNLGFVFRVHELAYGNDPHGYEVGDRIVVLTDWREPEMFQAMQPWFLLAGRQFPEIELRPLGPGAGRLPFPYTTPLSDGRLDTWRWMARSLALLDPAPHRLLGRNAIEALQYGVPVLVPATGGASREHAELGSGGLWYRSYQDLAASIGLLRDKPDVRQELSTHGRAYAEDRYGDPKRFIASVTEVVSRVVD